MLVLIYTVAMAYLESAVVVYLRAMYGIENLMRDINFRPDVYTFIEIGREAATIIMLVTLSLIAGNNWSKRIGYFFLSFGIWDIFYYIWLYVFIQWPRSLFEWDVLFLIPLPWWGPVITPILVSVLLITIGLLLIYDFKFKISSFDLIIFCLSIVIILYTFMEDSIKIILSGNGNLTEVRPTNFNWILFLLSIMAWVVVSLKVSIPSIKQRSKSQD